MEQEQAGRNYLTAHACFRCRRSFKMPREEVWYRTCPRCGGWALDLGRNFKPPKSSDQAQWAKIEFLAHHGFVFQKIFPVDDIGGRQVGYPETLAEAKEFVKQYAGQALDVPPPPANGEPAA